MESVRDAKIKSILRGKTVIHAAKHFLGLEAAATQTTAQEREMIKRFACGKMRALEIGVFEGLSTTLIARNMHPDGILIAIDPFFGGYLGICWSKTIAQRELRRAAVYDKVQLIEAFSHQACKQVSGGFDYVFIDGDHSQSAIEQDWKDWSPRVERHGVMLLHDTAIPKNNPPAVELGSHRYFREVISRDPRFEIIEVVDSLSVLQRV